MLGIYFCYVFKILIIRQSSQYLSASAIVRKHDITPIEDVVGTMERRKDGNKLITNNC